MFYFNTTSVDLFIPLFPVQGQGSGAHYFSRNLSARIFVDTKRGMEFAPDSESMSLIKRTRYAFYNNKTDTEEYEVLTNMMYRAVKNGETKYISIVHSFGDYNLKPYIKNNFCGDPKCRCSVFNLNYNSLSDDLVLRAEQVKTRVREWGCLLAGNRFYTHATNVPSLLSEMRDIERLLSPWCLEYSRLKIRRLFETAESKSSAFHTSRYLWLKVLALKRRDGWLREIDDDAHIFDLYEDGALAVDDLRRTPHVDIVAHFKTTEANARARNLILCAHTYDAASRFHVDVFPLDMLKLVVCFAGLIPPRDPLYEQRTQLIAWKNKPCLCLK